MIWIPDFCPAGNCKLRVSADWTTATFISLCAHHQAMRARRTDAQIFQTLLQSTRAKEAARKVAKRELALDKEHPGVWYRVDADGGFTLGVDQRGTRMPEWPNGATRTALATKIDEEVALLERTADTSLVRSA